MGLKIVKLTFSKSSFKSGITIGTDNKILFTGKRVLDVNNITNTTSSYYVHKHKTLTTKDDYILDKVGFENLLFEDERKIIFENPLGENDMIVERNRQESVLFDFKKTFKLTDIKNNLEKIKPYMRSEGIAHIEANDIYYLFDVDEPVTSLVNNAECVFVHFDEKNIAKCAIETAHLAGDIENVKPLSCHLYPIRVVKLGEHEALNYHRWPICDPACILGKKEQVTVHQFLKGPLVRRYGSKWYKGLEEIYKHWKKQ